VKIVILANDDIPYSGLLSYPVLKKFANEISGIFIQDRILDSNTTTLGLFNKVKKKSSLQFAIFYAREIINYKIAVLIRRIFHMNKHSNDCYIETNANLGKMFGIPVFKIEGSINDEIWLNKINEIKPDLIICIRYAEILKNSLLTIPNGGVINFHPSLLPKYKGMAPIFQALLHNENEIGFSLHYIDEGIDTGKIIKRQKIKTEKNESVSHIAIRAHVVAGYELLSILNNLKKGDKKTEQITQDNGNYFSWPEKKDVKKFMQSNKKYVEFRDFLSLVFYNPRNLKI
jgi:methionyl-tRNA formyltransferase|tara:strand:- start:840 stop:1700 length:861 start_codon:yes stop_codon:yes gene_type:complete